jgi:hypothetical protein
VVLLVTYFIVRFLLGLFFDIEDGGGVFLRNVSLHSINYKPLYSRTLPRVQAGKNTSTVIPASCKRPQKGNPVVSEETVMYGCESSATLTTDRLHYNYRPVLSSEKASQDEEQSNCKERGV